MFDPDQADVRRFFCEAWRTLREREPLAPLEAIAADWVAEHSGYHAELESLEQALAADYGPSTGRENPFLHLAMHLAISEQLSVDQPPGIRAAHAQIAQRTGSAHEAAHEVMECLGAALWQSQRDRAEPDAEAYLACLRRRAAARRV
ncbi:MAG: DUF1841 family protein [Burkholderiaceae bacterium]|nr:DUF1841 family protein [Burkholderiaceae bacterium]